MKTFFDEIRRGASPNLDACVEALGDRLPLLRRFRETPQDPEWHAEGDVHIHTQMVMDEAYQLLAGPAAHLEGEGRLLLVLGALLHDIAKPICTRPQELKGVERIVARGHEAAGRSYLAPRLLEELPYPSLEVLLGLVGHHHEPKFLVVKERSAGAYQRVSRLADPELLYWVEQADMRGRTCRDRAEAIEKIDLYRLFAEDYGAFVRHGDQDPSWRARLVESLAGHGDQVIDLALAEARRSLERGEIHSLEEAVARSFQAREARSDLVITVGPSGSGKTTFVQKHLVGFDHLSLDDLREELGSDRGDQGANDRVLAEGRERLKASLRKQRPVVWDATSLRQDFRTRVAGLGFDYGALVTLVVFHLDLADYHRRNRARTDAVPPNVLDNQLERMEWPELDEAHRVLFLDGQQRVRAAFGVHGALPYGLAWAPARP